MFLDEVRLRVSSGAGGPGSASFRHEKFVPLGGPDGGNGGRGADIILVGNRGFSSLSHFRGRRVVSGERGGAGARRLRHGADADPVRLPVPIGTLVRDQESGETLGEITSEGQEILVARGGRGGRGNSSFATSRARAPKFAELGEPSQQRDIALEMRLIADVGLVGAPNAGKSTLLARLTAATPRVASYPFTTLEPNLGVLEDDEHRLVLADVPGLIEGASLGTGLGTEFLKHLGKTSLLVHVLDCSQPYADCLATWEQVSLELERYDAPLAGRVRVAALNKVDLPGATECAKRLAKELAGPALACHQISAQENTGVSELVEGIYHALAQVTQTRVPALRVYRPEPLATGIRVEYDGEAYRVTGKGVEAIVARTDVDNPDALARMRQRLSRMGLREELLKAGASGGDTIVVAGSEFAFDPDF